MGSREKAKKFLETSETQDLYSNIIEHTLGYFIAKAEKEGNQAFADQIRKARDDYKQDFKRALEITEEVYSEIFSDEELDELIVIHSTPAIKKLRGLTSEIMKRVFERYIKR